jgi:release factor glutamine methyltransferase
MNLDNILSEAAKQLKSHNVEDSQAEAILLLRHILKISTEEIYINPSRNLSPDEYDSFQKLLTRRITGEPAAYILNHKEFFGLDFYVDQRVLIPRPETELLVEETLKVLQKFDKEITSHKRKINVADIGTGCGNIAISLAMHSNNINIFAVDSSLLALEVALTNCINHHVESSIRLLQGNNIDPIPYPVDIIVANLPYIKQSELTSLQPEITHFEPCTALNGGDNGLNHITQLLSQISKCLSKPRCVLLEIGAGQSKPVAMIIDSLLPQYHHEFKKDLNDIDRVVVIDQ